MSNLIAFIGNMGVGKSTCMKIIREEIGSLFTTNVKFAQALYDMQTMIYNRSGLTLEGAKDRKLLQWLGTDWGRGIDENIWVNIWERDVRKAWMNGQTVFCDDLRFMNEFDKIKSMGGLVIRIIGESRCDTLHQSHSSELEHTQMKQDLTIMNDSTEELLRERIKETIIPQILLHIDNNFLKGR